MKYHRNSNFKSTRSFEPLENHLDNILETGKQLFDGVAGNRPGNRKFVKPTISRLENVGKWMESKIDLFLEDYDTDIDSWQSDKEKEMRSFSSKKPLKAISLRVKKAIEPSKQMDLNNSEGEWPQDSDFRVEKWERQDEVNSDVFYKNLREKKTPKRSSQRPLPRSSRRRN